MYLRWLKNKSLLLSLGVNAICVGRINIMNRQYQGRGLNFKSYTVSLEKTLEALRLIAESDAVTSWLSYRVEKKETGLGKYFQLNDKDKAVCKARTDLFTRL